MQQHHARRADIRVVAGGAGTRAAAAQHALEGVLAEIRDANRALRPWAASDLSAELLGGRAERGERLRATLLALRERLARIHAVCAADREAVVPQRLTARVRELSGRMHEAAWLARQASRRSAHLSALISAECRGGDEMVQLVLTLQALGRDGTRIMRAA